MRGNGWFGTVGQFSFWLVLGLVGLVLLLGPAGAVVAGKATIDSRVLADTEGGQHAHFLVTLTEQADLSAAVGFKTKAARGEFVVQQLKSVATRTQPAVTQALDAMAAPYRTFWIANMIAVEGDRAVVEALAANPAVAKIEPDRAVQLLNEPFAPQREQGQQPAAIEWGVSTIRAPEVWAQGYTGEGIVIGAQDTGIQWDHPAIKNQYRGWNGATANHDYNWWDAIHSDVGGGGNPECGFSRPTPCDDAGHGTHTLATAVGDDGAGNQVGVAPGARWIGCRNMDQGVGRPSTYTECFQFFTAPWDSQGQNPRPDLAADIVTNSWGCPFESENCVIDSFKTVVENMRAAGIMVIVSAGNDGYAGCSTVVDPPAYFDAVTTVGATTPDDSIAPFSSRGPVLVDGSSRVKPDLTAPGDGVRSAFPQNGYATLSGTSMAAPHVAGAAALLWSARPTLKGEIDITERLLFGTSAPHTTTQDCDPTGDDEVPNNIFGWGRLDIDRAVNTPLAVRLSTLSARQESGYREQLLVGVTLVLAGGLLGLVLGRITRT